MNTPRYAIYYAPPADAALARLGATWLGRDVDQGCPLTQPAVTGLPTERLFRLTAAPRHYGFHATLKAPFHLAPGATVDDLAEAVRSLARELPPVTIPRLQLSRIAHFLALTPRDAAAADLQALAACCVSRLHPFRAPLSEEELQRRRVIDLSEAQQRLLDRWGYPYVMDEFRFHMTLTGEIGQSDAELLTAFLGSYFCPALDEPHVVDGLSLFEQMERNEPFCRSAVFPLLGTPAEPPATLSAASPVA